MWTSWEMEKYKQLQPEICPRSSTMTDSSLNVDQMSRMELPEEEAEAFDELVIPHDDEQPLLQPPPPPFDEEEIEENSDDMSHARSNTMEANSRRKLNQQFLTLSFLVPNSTKMDKRSILGDALAYLQDLTQQIDTETENIRLSSDDASTSSYNETKVHEPVQTTLHAQEFSGALPAFSEVEVEVLEEGIFLLKILCNNVMGAVGRVYRAIEMLDLEITYISTDQSDQETTQTTAFLSVKEKGLIALEQLCQHVLLNAQHLGLLPPPNG